MSVQINSENLSVENQSRFGKICNVYGCFDNASERSINKDFCEKHSLNCKLNDPDDCPICMEKLTYKTHLQCGHCFHDDCIDTWLSSNNTCPLCRQKCNNWENDLKYQLGFPILERSDGYYDDVSSQSEQNELIFMNNDDVLTDNNHLLIDNEIISVSYVQNNGNDFDNWIREQIMLFISPEYSDNVYNCLINNDYFLRQCFIYFYNKENVDNNELEIFFNFIRMCL